MLFFLEKEKMSLGEIIDYFRNELRNKLQRPNCHRVLGLWDRDCWIKPNIKAHFIINSNEFLLFWYETCYELCCVNNPAAIALRNALDKYFYFLLDFENYFSIFISRRTFSTRKHIMDAVIDYNLDKDKIRSKVKRNKKIEDLFKEFVNRVNEWNYWKKVILVEFLKINIGQEVYNNAQKHSLKGLSELLQNTEKLFDKGVQGNDYKE